MPIEITKRDYSLTGRDTKPAEERGLANADWYTCNISRQRLKELMQRRDGPAIRDTLIWFALLIISGTLGYRTWGTWWAFPCFCVYGVLYASSSDSRWHESGHRTAFKTVWMNDVLYEIASFMDFRESVPWRWSHTRHHTDTIIVGRDPEIQVPRPADLLGLALKCSVSRGCQRISPRWCATASDSLLRRRRLSFPLRNATRSIGTCASIS
jgi:fatty acid desaturase